MKNNLSIKGLIIVIAVAIPSVVGAVELGGVDSHGFISQGYLKSSDNIYLADTETGTFEFSEVGINLSTRIDKLRLGAQLLSKDLGVLGNYEVIMDWAMGDYRINEKIGVRAGKIKMPLGFYNQERDIDLLRVSVLLPSAVYDEGSREIYNTYQGAGIYGLLGSDASGEFAYEVYGGTLSVDLNSAFMKYQEDSFAELLPAYMSASNFYVTVDFLAGGALRWTTPLDGLRLGMTYTYHEYVMGSDLSILMAPGLSVPAEFSGEGDMVTWVASVEYIWNNLMLVGEYKQRDLDFEGEIVGIPGSETEATQRPDGWYVMATYDINYWLSAGMFYSSYCDDRRYRDGEAQVALGNPDYFGWQEEVVPSLRFSIGGNWLLKAEAHFITGAAQAYGYNNPGGREEDWTLYALKTTFSF